MSSGIHFFAVAIALPNQLIAILQALMQSDFGWGLPLIGLTHSIDPLACPDRPIDPIEMTPVAHTNLWGDEFLQLQGV